MKLKVSHIVPVVIIEKEIVIAIISILGKTINNRYKVICDYILKVIHNITVIS